MWQASGTSAQQLIPETPSFFVIQIAFPLFSSIYFLMHPISSLLGLNPDLKPTGLNCCLIVQIATLCASPTAVCKFPIKECQADLSPGVRDAHSEMPNGSDNTLVRLRCQSSNQALEIEHANHYKIQMLSG